MPQHTRSATLVVLAFALAVAPGARASDVSGAAAEVQAAENPSPSAAGAPYTSAKTCAGCHRLIHQYWSESAHEQGGLRAQAAGHA